MASVTEIFTAMAEALPTSKFPPKMIVMTVNGTTYQVDGASATVTLITSTTTADSSNSIERTSKKADLYVTTSLEVLQNLLQKKFTPQQAFMKGLLKIKGNMGLAMKLTLLVHATRKQLYPDSKL